MSDEVVDIVANHQMICIGGDSGAGKSASLRNIRNQEKWMYINCEAGKRLPFKNKFIEARISEPYQVWGYVDDAIAAGDACEGIIIDTATFMMDMFETQYIYGQHDTQKGWANYAQFWRTLIQDKLVKFGKPVIILAHVLEKYDETELRMKKSIPIKGALKNNGLEAYFSTVVEATKIPLKDTEKYDPNMFTISEDEEDLGIKYVFQTRLNQASLGTRIRSPMGMFNRSQLYMDNDAQMLLDHLHKFYDE